jgi:hypothetical protein
LIVDFCQWLSLWECDVSYIRGWTAKRKTTVIGFCKFYRVGTIANDFSSRVGRDNSDEQADRARVRALSIAAAFVQNP